MTSSLPRIQYVNSGLERRLTNIEIEVETGTRNAVLEGTYVVGEWDVEGEVHRIGAGRAIALDVLNLFLKKNRIADAILDFTKRFGPITTSYCRAKSFRFSLDEWIMARKRLHFVWKAASSGVKKNWPVNLTVSESDGDHFRFDKGRLVFRTQSLSRYTALEIASVPAEHLRMCENQKYGCKSPFFFAGDLRERYCSETCAHVGKRRIKLKWWNENRKGK